MKIKIYDVDFNNDILFDSTNPLRICCESKSYFSKIIKGLMDGINNKVEFENENQLLDHNDIGIIIDYYSIDSIVKSTLPKLFKQLDKQYKGDFDLNSKIQELGKSVEEIINDITEDINIEFDCSHDIDLMDILKFASIRPIVSNNSNFDYLINYLYLIDRLSLCKVLILVNLNSYFSSKEIIEIMKITKYCRINLIMLDDYISNKKFFDEQLLLIDSDYYDVLM